MYLFYFGPLIFFFRVKSYKLVCPIARLYEYIYYELHTNEKKNFNAHGKYSVNVASHAQYLEINHQIKIYNKIRVYMEKLWNQMINRSCCKLPKTVHDDFRMERNRSQIIPCLIRSVFAADMLHSLINGCIVCLCSLKEVASGWCIGWNTQLGRKEDIGHSNNAPMIVYEWERELSNVHSNVYSFAHALSFGVLFLYIFSGLSVSRPLSECL